MYLNGFKIFRIDQTDSTNKFAANLINEGNESKPFIVITQTQLKGKGQGINTWESEPGKNLTFSIAVFPENFQPQKQFLISKAVSLSIREVLQKDLKDVSIKWPNDIYTGNKKIAGILIENSIKGSGISHSIIGIGLNINQTKFRSAAPNPISLKMVTGKDYDPEIIFRRIIESIEKRFSELFLGIHREMDAEYENCLYLTGKEAAFLENGYEFRGMIEGVNDYGQLKIRTGNKIRVFSFNEIKFLIE